MTGTLTPGLLLTRWTPAASYLRYAITFEWHLPSFVERVVQDKVLYRSDRAVVCSNVFEDDSSELLFAYSCLVWDEFLSLINRRCGLVYFTVNSICD